jgi:S-adenosylmethionine:diacylglycerol 3-amino-3-carboxypropyl transferase
MTAAPETAWEAGRFDARRGARKVLFGRMYEDAAIELAAFKPGGRVFCIASAGCTAMQLAPRHRAVAVDINPVQLEYARRRLAGGPMQHGSAERLMASIRAFALLVGWRASRLREFLELDDPAQQIEYWRRHLDTRRFRAVIDTILSISALKAVYASPFLALLPPRLGAVMRGRMERCFARHSNRQNPYARALLLGELDADLPSADIGNMTLVCADAAEYLENATSHSFDGFTLSNILDGATPDYEQRLFSAVKRAAAPSAVVVRRSFREPAAETPTNRAADDRAMLWGIVDVSPATAL